MAGYVLVIGNKNYSSWSMRPWLLLRTFGLPFAEVRIPLDRPETAAALAAHSPAGRVPVLKHDSLVVWDSLAIIEYLAERHPDRPVWPRAADARARARSLAAEMHAGFAQVRAELPMDCRARHPQHAWSAAAEAEITRLRVIWAAAPGAPGGPFLFGPFGAVDAMFAPVVSRCLTYGVPLAGAAAAYRDAVLGLPAFKAWLADAEVEPEVIEVP